MKKAPVKFVSANNAKRTKTTNVIERTGDEDWGNFIKQILLGISGARRTAASTMNYRIFWFTTFEEKNPAIRT